MGSTVNLEKASLALKEGRSDEALDIAIELLAENSDLPKAHEIAGFAASHLENWELAYKHWRSLTEIQPARLGPYLQTVTALSALSRHKDALDFINQAIDLSDENFDLEVERIRILNRVGEFKVVSASSAELEKKLIKSENFTALIALARLYSERGESSASARLFKRAKELNPESLDPDIYHARLSYANGDLDLAWDLWASLSKAPNFSRPYEPMIFLARIAWKREIFELVEKYAILAQGYEPHQIEPYTVLTSVYFRQRKISKAEVITKKFSANFPQSNLPALNHAKILEYQGEINGAQSAYLTIVENWPDDLNVALAYSEFLKNNNCFSDALGFWKHRAKLDPDQVSNHAQIVLLLEKAKRWGDVVKYIEGELLPRDPGHEAGLLSVGGALRFLARRDEAQIYFERGYTLHPTNMNFWIGYIANLVTADEEELAKSTLKRAEKYFSEINTKNLYDLARLYITAENRRKAKLTLGKILDIDPEHTQGTLLLSRLIMVDGQYLEAKQYVQRLREHNSRDLETTKNSAIIGVCAQFKTRKVTTKTKFLAPESIFKEIMVQRKLIDESPLEYQESSAIIVTSTLGSGGAERQVVATVNGLISQKGGFNKVCVVTEDLDPNHGKNFFREDIEDQGNSVRSLNEMGGRILTRNLMATDYNVTPSVRLLEAMTAEISNFAVPLYAVLKMENPEVVHTWQDTTNIAGGFAALLAGVPRIILSTRSTRPDARRRKRRYLAPGYKIMLKHSGVVMLNNSKAGARDYEDWLGLAKGTVKTIYNGLDIKAIRKRGGKGAAIKVRKELGFPSTAFVLGGVMRFSEEKRPNLWVDVAMNAALNNPNACFVIVGDGPMRAPLMQKVGAAGLADRIKFPGGQHPIEPWISAMDMLFLSSRMEGLPNVLIESQTLGVPVASMAVGGSPEAMIKNKTGILFTTPNAARIAKGIFERMNDKQWMGNAREAGKTFVETLFSNEVMAMRTLKAYKGQLDD